MRLLASFLLSSLVVTLAACGGGSGLAPATKVVPNLGIPTPPPQKVTIDVPAITLAGDITIDGQTPPGDDYHRGRLHLAGEGLGRALLGHSNDGSYEAIVIPGSYETLWEHIQGDGVPANQLDATLPEASLAASQVRDVDVATVTVSPVFLLDGGSFPGVVYDSARILLRQGERGQSLLLGKTHLANPPVQVIPGTYEVVYDYTEGSTVPRNRMTVVRSVDLRSDTFLVVDVPTARPIVTPTLDGAPFPPHPYEHAKFALRESGGTGRVALGSSFDDPRTPKVLIPGTYDVFYQYVEGDLIPQNTGIRLATGVAVGDGPLDIDVESAEITLDVTLDGAAFADNPYNAGTLSLETPESAGKVVVRTWPSEQATPRRVVKGTYDLYYGHVEGADVPQNAHAHIATNVVVGADGVIAANVATAQVTPTLRLNGGPFPVSPAHGAAFDLRGTTPGDTFLLAASQGPAAPVRVVQDTYDVIYRHVAGSNVPQNTRHLVAEGIDVFEVPPDLTIDVAARRVLPTFTQNGQAYPAYQIADFSVRDADLGSLTPLGVSDADNPPRMLILGRYDIRYDWQEGNEIARNEAATLGAIDVVAP